MLTRSGVERANALLARKRELEEAALRTLSGSPTARARWGADIRTSLSAMLAPIAHGVRGRASNAALIDALIAWDVEPRFTDRVRTTDPDGVLFAREVAVATVEVARRMLQRSGFVWTDAPRDAAERLFTTVWRPLDALAADSSLVVECRAVLITRPAR